MKDLPPKCKLCGGHPNNEPPMPASLHIPGITYGLRQRKGRPRIEDKGKSFEATKPWLALGMSRRTWYARRKEKANEKTGPSHRS